MYTLLSNVAVLSDLDTQRVTTVTAPVKIGGVRTSFPRPLESREPVPPNGLAHPLRFKAGYSVGVTH